MFDIRPGRGGTRLLKDWERAADTFERQQRWEYRRRACSRTSLFTNSSSSSLAGVAASQDSVMTRGPLSKTLGELGDDASGSIPLPAATFDAMHQQCQDIFAALDTGRIGMITMEALESSFDRLHARPPVLRMNRHLFDKYVLAVLPENCEGVTLEQFLMFHRRVWENQPLAVRSAARNSVQELYNSEFLVRQAYAEYDKDHLGLPKEALPSVLKDLGLHMDRYGRDQIDKLFEHDFGAGDRLSFHEFVRFKNDFMEGNGPAKPRVLARSSSTPCAKANRIVEFAIPQRR